VGRGELLLLVDDEPAILESTRELLELNHYRVLTAADGREALEIFVAQQGKVRLVITDLSMPVMNGVALVRTLRTLQTDLKVIAASGLDDESKRAELLTLGVGDVLIKPLYPAQLLGLLRRHLSTGRSDTPFQQPTRFAP
jgi:two-component system cell cycle sensor histidine kinase/response regulator CckA